MKKIKKPDPKDAERCLEYRRHFKKGWDSDPVSTEALKFCNKMRVDFPAWYDATMAKVFNDCVPFGSNCRLEEPEI